MTLQERLQTRQKLDDHILELTDDDSIVNEIEEAGNFRTEVHEILLRIDQVLIDNKSDKPDHNVSISSGVVSEASASCGTKHVARLPELVLKKFKGEACQCKHGGIVIIQLFIQTQSLQMSIDFII